MKKVEQEGLEERVGDAIRSVRYTTQKEIGRGCWGIVYSGFDEFTGEGVAIKVLSPSGPARRQMIERNLDEIKAMKKEAGRLAACSNVVPRWVDFDEDTKFFLVMPKYDRFLGDILMDDSDRAYLNHGLSMQQIHGYLVDIAKGLWETHNRLGRIHGDVKPSNLAVDHDDTVLVNDLGTSTYSSEGASGSPRDNMGFLYTRAPECFVKGSHPTKKSDIFAFGSLAYRFLTGGYIFEEEINNSRDPSEYFAGLDGKAIVKALGYKLRKAPRRYRTLLRGCLSDVESRYPSMNEIRNDLTRGTGGFDLLRSRSYVMSALFVRNTRKDAMADNSSQTTRSE